MILGIGCDIVKISRFAKEENFLQRFMKKYLTIKEAEEIKNKKEYQHIDGLVLAVATRFAGKEAVAKALGMGFQEGITLKDIEIIHDELGCPHVTLYKNALHRAYELSKNQKVNMHITLANEQEYANAVAVLESI